MLGSTADLVLVVVQANNVDVRETSNLTGGSTDTTTDIEHAHTGAEVHLGGEVVFVAGEGGTEAFAFVETREVERAGPGVLVEESSSVIVTWSAKVLSASKAVCEDG